MSVQTQYWDERQLASWYIHSPDPKLYYPDIGQKLFVSWTVPEAWLSWEDLGLSIETRYRNRKEDSLFLPIDCRRGTYTLSIMNELYCTTGGFLTYRITLVGNGEVEEEWVHPLWGMIIDPAQEN